MSIVEIVFSPTGGTQKVAQIISSQWDENSVRIDLGDAKTDFSKCRIAKQDRVLIAMPVFGCRPPAVAIERLKHINGNGAKCTLVCVYGNGAYENTLSEMMDEAETSGFQVIAAIAAVAEHSIISQYAAGRPDEIDRKQLKDFADQIRDKIGNISAKLGNQLPEETGGTESVPEPPSEPPLPKPGESCVKCGSCVEKCPVQAISSEDFVSDVGKCIYCMRCVKQCPNKARKVKEEIVSAASLALRETCSGRKENELFL